MASSDKKVVRLTFNSLEELAKERDNSHSGRKCIQKSKSSRNTDEKKRTKRPDQQIYRPNRRLHRDTDGDDEEQISPAARSGEMDLSSQESGGHQITRSGDMDRSSQESGSHQIGVHQIGRSDMDRSSQESGSHQIGGNYIGRSGDMDRSSQESGGHQITRSGDMDRSSQESGGHQITGDIHMPPQRINPHPIGRDIPQVTHHPESSTSVTSPLSSPETKPRLRNKRPNRALYVPRYRQHEEMSDEASSQGRPPHLDVRVNSQSKPHPLDPGVNMSGEMSSQSKPHPLDPMVNIPCSVKSPDQARVSGVEQVIVDQLMNSVTSAATAANRTVGLHEQDPDLLKVTLANSGNDSSVSNPQVTRNIGEISSQNISHEDPRLKKGKGKFSIPQNSKIYMLTSDLGEMSDQSHDSLEWDYEAEMGVPLARNDMYGENEDTIFTCEVNEGEPEGVNDAIPPITGSRRKKRGPRDKSKGKGPGGGMESDKHQRKPQSKQNMVKSPSYQDYKPPPSYQDYKPPPPPSPEIREAINAVSRQDYKPPPSPVSVREPIKATSDYRPPPSPTSVTQHNVGDSSSYQGNMYSQTSTSGNQNTGKSSSHRDYRPPPPPTSPGTPKIGRTPHQEYNNRQNTKPPHPDGNQVNTKNSRKPGSRDSSLNRSNRRNSNKRSGRDGSLPRSNRSGRDGSLPRSNRSGRDGSLPRSNRKDNSLAQMNSKDDFSCSYHQMNPRNNSHSRDNSLTRSGKSDRRHTERPHSAQGTNHRNGKSSPDKRQLSQEKPPFDSKFETSNFQGLVFTNSKYEKETELVLEPEPEQPDSSKSWAEQSLLESSGLESKVNNMFDHNIIKSETQQPKVNKNIKNDLYEPYDAKKERSQSVRQDSQQRRGQSKRRGDSKRQMAGHSLDSSNDADLAGEDDRLGRKTGILKVTFAHNERHVSVSDPQVSNKERTDTYSDTRTGGKEGRGGARGGGRDGHSAGRGGGRDSGGGRGGGRDSGSGGRCGRNDSYCGFQSGGKDSGGVRGGRDGYVGKDGGGVRGGRDGYGGARGGGRDSYGGVRGSGRDGHGSARGGGILHVTPGQLRGADSVRGSHGSSTSPRGGRGRGAARGGTHRVLYDPNNPEKAMPPAPHLTQSHDPYDMSADTYQYSPETFYRPVSDLSDTDHTGSPQGRGDGFYGHNYRETAYVDDTYSPEGFHGDYEHETSGGGSSHPHGSKANTELLLHELSSLDSKLSGLLARRIRGEEGFAKVSRLRWEIQKKYEQIILLDADSSNKYNVEQTLWKTAFYQVIESLRREMAEDETENIKHRLMGVLDQGTTFYQDLLQKLQDTYRFTLDDYIDHNKLPPETTSRTVKLALLSAQRTMINLGDVARYKEQTNHTANYGKARSWYMKSQQIAPKNGRPYNQLAILALYTRRKLDAVYYYMRSLAASNPFLTARESLMSLFDEARKKAQSSEKKRQIIEQERIKSSHGRADNNRQRIEVWLSPDGKNTQDEIHGDGNELNQLPSVELNKRFIVSYLNVHGKLFTKIGMEVFPEAWGMMLKEFKALIEQSPVPIGNHRLLQLMAINMYAIENVVNRERGHISADCRTLIQEQAVQLGLDMFGLLAFRCVDLFRQHMASGNFRQVLSEDLHQLFPSVKVWSDWMTCHVEYWNPPPLPSDPSLGPNVDVWESIAEMCTVLNSVDISHVKLYTQKKEGCEPLLIHEDVTMAGFVPLLGLAQFNSYIHSTVDKDVARDCHCVEKLRTFGDYLCGIEPPILQYDVHTHRYISLVTPNEQSSENDSFDRDVHSREDDDVIVESSEDDLNTSGSTEDGHIKALRAHKATLQQAVEKQQQQEQSRQQVLDTSKEHRPITLMIMPVFLVPDTNCFIDNLAGIQQLVSSKRFTLVIPLVVINELDGLSKGSREGQYDSREHAAMVTAHTRTAIQYLEKEFGARNCHLRALTSKGNTMDTISFRSEETDSVGNNDDLILSCCLHYCKDKARDFMPKNKDEPIKLHREVVLLTDDRNLRLKAHTRNVPVRDIENFITWAKVS